MRSLLIFIAGGVFVLVIAIAWMPRTAWVELIDHSRFPTHASPILRHGYHNNFNSPGFVPLPFIFDDAKHIRPRDEGEPSLYFLASEPIFQLTGSDIESLCLNHVERPELFKVGRRHYHVTLTHDAKARFQAVMKDYVGDGPVSPEIRVVDRDDIYFAMTYTNAQELERTKSQPLVFELDWYEPYLENGEKLLDFWTSGQPIEACSIPQSNKS